VLVVNTPNINLPPVGPTARSSSAHHQYNKHYRYHFPAHKAQSMPNAIIIGKLPSWSPLRVSASRKVPRQKDRTWWEPPSLTSATRDQFTRRAKGHLSRRVVLLGTRSRQMPGTWAHQNAFAPRASPERRQGRSSIKVLLCEIAQGRVLQPKLSQA